MCMCFFLVGSCFIVLIFPLGSLNIPILQSSICFLFVCLFFFLFASGALTLGYLNINLLCLATERRVLISEERTCYSGLRYADSSLRILVSLRGDADHSGLWQHDLNIDLPWL